MGKKYTEYTADDFFDLTYEEAELLRVEIVQRHEEIQEQYRDIISEWNNFNFYMHALDAAQETTLRRHRKKKEPKATFLYMMIDGHTNLTKIGISKNPTDREATLQGQMPLLELFWQCESERSEETQLHEFFDEKRVRGEWFDLSMDDVRYIKSLDWRK